jgi:hypothetical protein
MGRSRGGLTTKNHALVDADGLPIALKLTVGFRRSAARQSESGFSDNQRHISWWNEAPCVSGLSIPKPPTAVAQRARIYRPEIQGEQYKVAMQPLLESFMAPQHPDCRAEPILIVAL